MLDFAINLKESQAWNIIAYHAGNAVDYNMNYADGSGGVVDATGHTMTTNESQLGHMFRNAEGHFSEDTLANRGIIESAAGSKANYLGHP